MSSTRSPARQRTILIWRNRALGDSVLCLPAVAALAHRGPIEVVGYPRWWHLAAHLIERAHEIESPLFAGLFTGHLDASLAIWLSDVGTAVVWCERDLTPALHAAGVPVVVHERQEPPPGIHASEWLLRTVQPLLQATMGLPQFVLQPHQWEAAYATLAHLNVARPIAIHPGSAHTWKRWPVEHFRALAGMLADHGLDPLLIEGPDDSDAIQFIQAGGPYPVVRGLDPASLAGVLYHCLGYVGNDSGVTHLAAYAGVPSVAIFGPTDPQNWAPWNARVVRHCRAVTPTQGTIRTCYDPDCLHAVQPREVLSALLESITAVSGAA